MMALSVQFLLQQRNPQDVFAAVRHNGKCGQRYLKDGAIPTNYYYLNSIGSVNSVEEIHTKANEMSIQCWMLGQKLCRTCYNMHVIL